jgi:hypothetical protein
LYPPQKSLFNSATMTTIAVGFFDEEKDFVTYHDTGGLNAYLHDFASSRPPKHSMEVIKPGQDVCAYYDIDYACDYAPAIPQDHRDFILNKIDLEIRDFNGFGPYRSVCESHGRKKLSWHLVYNYRTTRKDLQATVQPLNARIKCVVKIDHDFLDHRVYHNNQRWRVVGCTKPATGINNADPEQRVKKCTFGLLVDSMVTHFNNDTKPWHYNQPLYPHLASGNDVETVRIPPSAYHLLWFQAVLKDEMFLDLFTEKASSYETWILVGRALFVEGKEHKCKSAAQLLFQQFSSLCPHKFSAADCRSKFESAFNTINVSEFPKIKSYVTKHNKDQAAKYDKTYTHGRLPVSEQPLLVPVDVDLVRHLAEEHDGLELNFAPLHALVPFDSGQYRLNRHLSESSALVHYWENEIKQPEHLIKLYSLARWSPCDKQNEERLEVAATCMASESAYGKSCELPFSFRDEKANYIQWFKCLAILFGIRQDVDLWNTWLTEKIDKDKRKELDEKYTAAWKTYEETCLKLDEDVYRQVESDIHDLFIYRLCSEETCDFLARLEDLMEIATEDVPRWWMHCPYRSFLKDMHMRWEHLGQPPLELVFMHYLPLLKADRKFHYLGRCYSTHTAAELVANFYPHWMQGSEDSIFVFDYLSGKWSDSESTHLRIISEFKHLLQGDGTSPNFGESPSLKTAIVTEIKALAFIATSVQRHQNLERSGTRKLLFPNGYYDGQTGKFVPRAQICPMGGSPIYFFTNTEVVFYGSIPDPYLLEVTPESRAAKEFMFDVFYRDLVAPETRDFFIENIATGLMLEPKKEAICPMGDTNAGKSVFIRTLIASVGDVARTTNLTMFKHNPNSSGDSSIGYAFVAKNSKARLLFSSEGNCVLDSELFKSTISGGEDIITGRMRYGNDKQLDVHFRFFAFTNHALQFSKEENAIKDRVCVLQCPYTYVDEVVDPRFQRKKDDSIKLLRYKMIYRQMFVQILLDAYGNFRERGFTHMPRPEAVTANPVFQLNTALPQDYFSQLMYHIVFHGQRDHYVETAHLQNVFEAVEPNSKSQGSRRLGLFLQGLDLEFHQRHIFSGQKKIQGRNVAVWYGMSLRGIGMNTAEDCLALTDVELWKVYMRENNGVLSDHFLDELQEATRVAKRKKRGLDGEFVYSDAEKDLLAKYYLGLVDDM